MKQLMKQLREKGIEVLALVVALFALFIAWGANNLSADANNISGTALAVTNTEVARQHTSQLEVNRYLAKSPDLLADLDAQWINRRQLIPILIQSQYWLIQWSQYRDASQNENLFNSQNGYLFIFVINHGPAALEGIGISDISWLPKKDQQMPTGLDGYLGVLPARSFYAILIDVLGIYDPIYYLSVTHFETLELTINLKDELGREVALPINMGNVHAAVPTPPAFNMEPFP